MEEMSLIEEPENEVEVVEPTLDPVAYLRSLGIEAELVAVLKGPMAPAA